MSKTRVCLATSYLVMVAMVIHHLEHIHHSRDTPQLDIHHSRDTHQRVIHHSRDTPRLVILLVLILLQVILVAILLHTIQDMGQAWEQCWLEVQQQLQLLMVPTNYLMAATICRMVVAMDMVHTHMVASSSTTVASSNTMVVASSSMVSTVSMECLEGSSRNGSKMKSHPILI